MGEAKHRAGSSGLGTGPLHRVRQVHAGLSARDDSREGLRRERSGGRAGGVQDTCRRSGASCPTSSTPFRSRSKTAPAAGLCVEVCPAKDKSNVSRKALNMQPQLPLRDSERVNWDFFLTLPEIQAERRADFRLGQERATAATAVRVFRRVLRLRRNALHQADHSTVWRSRNHRQRDRMLEHLRRQPADHALHHQSRRTRSRLEQFAV